MPQLAIAAAGAAIGSATITGAVLGMTGAQLGWMAGSLLGSLLFAPDGPKAQMGDTRAPKIDFGSRLTRVYGTVRVPLNPRWIDDFTATEQSAGGKGGGGSSYYTYTTNALYWVADGINVQGVRKIWKNGELVYNVDAGADADTLAASQNSEHWSDMQFFDGNASQMPWSVYEAAVGSVNADAHRRIACIAMQNIACGNSPQVPFFEAEVLTAGTPETIYEYLPVYGVARTGDGMSDPDRVPPPAALSGEAGAPFWKYPTDSFEWDVRINPSDPAETILELGKLSLSDYNSTSTANFDACTWDPLDTIGEYPSGSGKDVQRTQNFGCVFVPGSNFLSNGNEVRLAYLPVTIGEKWTPSPVALADIVSAECLRCRGVTAADFDVSDLVGIDVAGFKCEGSARSAIEQLMAAYYFTAVPGRKVVFKRLDQSSVVTIPAADTGVGVDQAGEVFAGLMRANDLELPAQVSITGPNPSADHDPATATSDRLITVGNRIEQATWNVVFTPAQMKGRANANALDARVATHTATIAVSDKYAAYEIGDVVTHADEEGNSYTTRWLRESYSQGAKSVDVRLFDRSVLTLTGTMSDTYTPAVTVRGPASIETALILDTPIFRDADDSYGLYVTATGTGRWQGAAVYKSTDGASYTQVAQLATRGVIGDASVLPDFVGWTWDDTSTLTVTLDEGAGATLTSSTKTAIEADPSINAAVVGVHGRWEVVNFVTATLVSGTTYTLTGFLRGQKGTEWANATHASGDKFVLLRTVGIARIAGEAGDIGAVRYYKVVPAGATLADATAITITTAEQGLKPYAPVDIQATADSRIVWSRRSRLAYPPPYTQQPPLGEASEAYRVRVLDGAAVILEEVVGEPRWLVPPGLSTVGRVLEVCQLSAAIGPGHPAHMNLGDYVSLPSGWQDARRYFLTWLAESGGSAYLFDVPSVGMTDFHVLATSDGGQTYSMAYQGPVQPALILSQWEPAVLAGGEYLSITLNKYGNQAHQVLGELGSFASAVTSSHHRTLESWAVHGYPRAASGQVIDSAALWSDGTYFYVVGRYADDSQPAGALYLYRAGADGVFAPQGQMAQNPADPNMLPPGVGAFHSAWFTDDTFSRRSGKLFKHGSRWWFVGRHSAYYTDASDGLTGWLRAPLGFGEELQTAPLVELGDMLLLDATTLLMVKKLAFTGDCVSVSFDGGATWAASRPASIPSGQTVLLAVEFGADTLIYVYDYLSASMSVVSSSDLSTWSAAQPVTGMPTGGFHPALFYSLKAVAGSLLGVTNDGVAVHSADGIAFSIATMP